MSCFVATEFDCTHWQNIFLEKAKKIFAEQQTPKPSKLKLQEQEINTIKNQLIKTKVDEIVPQLIAKGNQFSTLVAQEFPQYSECIRLSVHCDKQEVNVSHKIPISLIYGHFGTPWHNATVVDQTHDECSLFKDTFKKKKDSFTDKKIGSFDIPMKKNTPISLQYIMKEKSS